MFHLFSLKCLLGTAETHNFDMSPKEQLILFRTRMHLFLHSTLAVDTVGAIKAMGRTRLTPDPCVAVCRKPLQKRGDVGFACSLDQRGGTQNVEKQSLSCFSEWSHGNLVPGAFQSLQ